MSETLTDELRRAARDWLSVATHFGRRGIKEAVVICLE
jgi:hypothetical protein